MSTLSKNPFLRVNAEFNILGKLPKSENGRIVREKWTFGHHPSDAVSGIALAMVRKLFEFAAQLPWHTDKTLNRELEHLIAELQTWEIKPTGENHDEPANPTLFDSAE